MKIAIDISPISKNSSSMHKVRGVGIYINMLVNNLQKFDDKNEYFFIENNNFPEKVDLIHYPYFDPFFLTLPNKFNNKTVVTVHDLTPLLFPKYFPAGILGKTKWFMQKNRLKKASYIVTDSDSSKKDIQKLVGIPNTKIRTSYLAVGEYFKPIKNEKIKKNIKQKFSLPDKFLLYVGDATWNKNLPRLISAVKKTEYKLVLVGKVWSGSANLISNNPWNNDLRQVTKEIDGDSQFLRLGFVSDDDLVGLYNLASALLMPSLYEGFGLPVLEAFSCGCPVVASDRGSLKEVASSAALIVDPEDEQQIVNSIKKIFESKIALEFSKKGLLQSKKFSISNMMSSLIRVYEEVYE